MKKVWKRSESKLGVKFSGKDFKQTLANIKSLPRHERKWNGSEWEVDFTDSNIEALLEMGFALEGELGQAKAPPISEDWKKETVPDKFNWLYDYQKDTFRYIKHHNGRGIMGLDAGLGKTATSLAYAESDEKHFPLLIIVPGPVKLGWRKTYNKFFKGHNRSIKLLYGIDSIKDYEDQYDVIIVNYKLISLNMESKKVNYVVNGDTKTKTIMSANDRLKKFIDKNNFQMVIMDECQRVASDKSKVYKGVFKICKNVPYVIGLSATPILNRPREFFNILNMVNPKEFPERYAFLNKFCDPQTFHMRGRTFTKYDGLTNGALLNSMLANHAMIRFLKQEVDDQLPPITSTVVPIELSNGDRYANRRQELLAEVADPNNGKMMIEIFEELKQLAYDEKKKECFEFIDNQLENVNKLIVFANHTIVLDDILERYGKKALKYDGKTTSKQKEENKERFINDPAIKILALNIVAGGTGIDGLQKAASNVIFLEFPWHDSLLNQAYSRLWRNGQKEKVFVYYLAGEGTIDEEIMELIDEKKDLFDQVMDGASNEEGDTLKALMRKYKEDIQKIKEKENGSKV